MNRLLFPVLAQTYLSQGGHEGSFAMDALFQMRAQKVIFGKLLSLTINNLRREKAPFLDFLRSHLFQSAGINVHAVANLGGGTRIWMGPTRVERVFGLNPFARPRRPLPRTRSRHRPRMGCLGREEHNSRRNFAHRKFGEF